LSTENVSTTARNGADFLLQANRVDARRRNGKCQFGFSGRIEIFLKNGCSAYGYCVVSY
jgi:hypothetical protein